MDGRLTFTEAAELAGVKRTTVSGWSRHGSARPDGTEVKLRIFRSAGRPFTTIAWLREFLTDRREKSQAAIDAVERRLAITVPGEL